MCFDVFGDWTQRLLYCGVSLPCRIFLNIRLLGSKHKVRLRSGGVKVCSRARVFFIVRIALLYRYDPGLCVIDYLRTARVIRRGGLRHDLRKLCHPHLHNTFVVVKLLLGDWLCFRGFSWDISHPDCLLAVFGMSIFEFLEPIFELLHIYLVFTRGKEFWLLNFSGLQEFQSLISQGIISGDICEDRSRITF